MNFPPRFSGAVACLRAQFIALILILPAAGSRGATLQITPARNASNVIALSWSNLGTNYSYTVQSRREASQGVWVNHPPTYLQSGRTNAWLPQIPPAVPAEFYRVAASNAPPAQRGKLRSSTLVHTYSTFEIALIFQQIGVQITPQYSVKLYKLLYETVDPFDNKTTASGAFLVPVNPPRAIHLVSYQHGTIVLTNDVPSRSSYEMYVGVAFATGGYAAAVPDYLGLGDSPGYHPFVHARSEATAVVDMLRAGKAFCASNSIALNAQLFLCGYSQGGHATMAAHREIQTRHAAEFTVTACAPMAGPYDFSGVTLTDALSGRIPPNPYYFAYLLAGYQSVYHTFNALSEALIPPYDGTIPPLMDGNHDGPVINDAMPANPLDALAPSVVDSLRNDPNYELRLALRENDVYEWRPSSPVRLYHCAGDEDVVFANSQTAYDEFIARGATNVQLLDPDPSADHGGCFLPSLTSAKAWFDSLKQ